MTHDSIARHSVHVTVNGVAYSRTVEPRLLLSDFLRHELNLTGTHVGCEHGSCGACTVMLDGEAVRSCILFAVQVDGHAITTVEGLASDMDHLHPVQEAFRESHGLQCGYCTPGFLMTIVPFLRDHPNPTEGEVRAALSGNLCRCTGYQNIVDAVLLAAHAREDVRLFNAGRECRKGASKNNECVLTRLAIGDPQLASGHNQLPIADFSALPAER